MSEHLIRVMDVLSFGDFNRKYHKETDAVYTVERAVFKGSELIIF